MNIEPSISIHEYQSLSYYLGERKGYLSIVGIDLFMRALFWGAWVKTIGRVSSASLHHCPTTLLIEDSSTSWTGSTTNRGSSMTFVTADSGRTFR